MGPRTLCGLFLCHLIWLSCGSPVEVVEGIAPTDGPEDLNFLKAEYIQVRDTLCNNDWTPWGFYCYRYFDGPKSFSDAEGECQSYSRYGHLSSIHSSDHRAFIHGLVQNLEHAMVGDGPRAAPTTHESPIGLQGSPKTATPPITHVCS
uniref:Uncharacterized protein n=1 Tax=Sphaerodactylus townsendi TaxID=933632 RepID=A0ACB8FLU1_9SAUR